MEANNGIQLICTECQWQGSKQEVEWEIVETCMGNDKIEICPICGGFNIRTK